MLNSVFDQEGLLLSSSPSDASICKSTSISTSLLSWTPVCDAPGSWEHTPASSTSPHQRISMQWVGC